MVLSGGVARLDFIGSHKHALDAKGRAFVPKQLLDELEKANEPRTLVVARGVKCLHLYPESEWRAYVAGVRAKPEGDPDRALIENVVIGQARRQPIDSTGRLLIPEELRRMAGITGDIVFVGSTTHIKLWDRARWELVTATSDEELEAAQQRLSQKR